MTATVNSDCEFVTPAPARGSLAPALPGEAIQTMSSSYSGHRLSMNCPHCGARARVRSSRALSALVRCCNLQCSNVECGHTFGAQLHITHTIAPSRVPNLEVTLPLAPRRLISKPANDTDERPPPLETVTA